MTTHAPPTGGLEARRSFLPQLGPKGALVYKLVTATQSTPLWLANLAVRIMPRSATPGELLAAHRERAEIDGWLITTKGSTNDYRQQGLSRAPH